MPNKIYETVLTEIDDYKSTVHGLLAFISTVTWDDLNDVHLKDSRHSLGRRMTRENGEIVTPDGVIQRGPSLGILVEVKNSLPADQTKWLQEIEQIQHYDTVASGWWTEGGGIDRYCSVLLIHQTRGVALQRYFENLLNTGQMRFGNPVCITEFNYATQRKDFIFIRKLWGEFSDNGVSEKLTLGKSIPIQDVLSNKAYGNIQFYDAMPPEEHTMYIIWNNIFTRMKSETKYDEQLAAWPLEIDLDVLTNELQKLHGSVGSSDREAEFPKKNWVERAMNAFVSLGYAERLENRHYLVKFRLLTVKDLVEHFSGFRKKIQPENKAQTKMFPDGPVVS